MAIKPERNRPNSTTGRIRALTVGGEGVLLDYPQQSAFNGMLQALRRKEGMAFKCKREDGKTRVWRTA